MRESRTIEFKQKYSKSFLKTVSAFANYGAGCIIFGVSDDGSIVGIDDIDELRLQIENSINDSLDPVPDYQLTVDDRDKTVRLEVQQGYNTPYYYRGKAYRRSDTSTVEVERAELNRLIMKGENLSFDVLESRERDMNHTWLSREFQEKLGIEVQGTPSLITLELMSPDKVFTNAGALLADNNSFPGIDAVRFGDNLNVILSRRDFSGISLLKQQDQVLALFDEYYAYEEIVGADRIKRYVIPREAFREAVANALVHRRWDVPANIKVSMFSDRIEIVSPGGLPEGVTKHDYLQGNLSIPRNPIVANVFFRLGYIERYGSGVPRILQEYADAQTSPRFDISDSCIKVTLPLVSASDFDTDERAVLSSIEKGATTTRAEVEKATGFSKGKTVAVLNRLVEQGMIMKEGTGRSVRYSRL